MNALYKRLQKTTKPQPYEEVYKPVDPLQEGMRLIAQNGCKPIQMYIDRISKCISKGQHCGRINVRYNRIMMDGRIRIFEFGVYRPYNLKIITDYFKTKNIIMELTTCSDLDYFTWTVPLPPLGALGTAKSY